MIVQKPIDDNYEIGVCLTWLYSVLSQAKEIFAVKLHGFTNILIKPMSAGDGYIKSNSKHGWLYFFSFE